MTPKERYVRILEILSVTRSVSVEELSRQLDASPETIRRDLNALAADRKIRKFHGGAELLPSSMEGAFQERMLENAEAKRAIARTAAPLFRPGDALFIDTGTTTICFAEALAELGGLSVITNSTLIAKIMARGGKRNSVYLLGGEYHDDPSETLGSLTVRQIAAFHARHVVLTVGGIDAVTGLMDYSVGEAEVARAMLAQGAQLTVLADASKLGKTALFEVCPLSRIHTLVVDQPPTGEIAQQLKKHGVRVLLAR